MIIKIINTLLPVMFLFLFFQAESRFKKEGISLAGKAPIHRRLFIGSKYSLILLWLWMVLELWNIHLPGRLFVNEILRMAGMICWIAGFLLMYTGRFSLGKSFRMGMADEKTEFIVNGIYRFSRNPMYLGLYLTFTGCILFSGNIFYALFAIAVVVIHHKITLAEEKILADTYGKTYLDYCKKVRRYI